LASLRGKYVSRKGAKKQIRWHNTAFPTGLVVAMQDRNFFLRTKLLPPRAVTELLQRPRLTKKLQANLGSPITMVAADAGCGKTTLIADFVRSQTHPTVWYQLDHTD